MRYTFPPDYNERTCYLVPINAALIPLVAGALRFFERRGSWANDQDYERGYAAFAELQVCFMKACIDDLVESNNRLYRMLDTAIFGVGYTVESTDPLVVTPAIPPQRTMGIYDEASLLGRLENLKQLLENGLNGTETPQYDRQNGVRDLLEQLLTAIQQTGQLDDEMLAKLAEIALLVA